MRACHSLTEGKRNQVYELKKAGLTQRAIADQIGVTIRRFAGICSATKGCADIDQFFGHCQSKTG